jgi:hypothetical protein
MIMADMRQFSGTESKHLKAKDFLGKNLKVAISEVQFVEFEAREGQPADKKAILLFEGKEKGLVLNGTNNDTLCNAYGFDSDKWIGKSISLTTKEYENFAPGWIVAPLDVEYDDSLPF